LCKKTYAMVWNHYMDHREFWFDSLSSPQRPNRMGDHEDFYLMDIGCYSTVIKRLERQDDHSLGSPNEDACVDIYLYSSIRPHNVELKLHNTTQHNTTRHNATQQNTKQHNTTRHNATQHNTKQCNTTQHDPTQCNTTQHIIYWFYGGSFVLLHPEDRNRHLPNCYVALCVVTIETLLTRITDKWDRNTSKECKI